MKTKFIFAIMALALFSCSKDNLGIGTNPELNVEKYTFAKDGGSLVLYSKINSSLQIGYQYFIDVNNGPIKEPIIKMLDGIGVSSIDGGWYSVERNTDGTLIIKVASNTTNKKREIPLAIMSLDYGCKTQYIQE